MNRYNIILLVPVHKEVLAMDVNEAGGEAERLCRLHNSGKENEIPTVVRSINYVQDEPEPIDFGFAEATA